jgi:hypothetical protein
MSSIAIQIITINPYQGDEGDMVISCRVIYGKNVNQVTDFSVYVNLNDPTPTVNDKIKAAAVSACSLLGITVGTLDQKTIVGGNL